MEKLAFLADLSDVNVSFIYDLESISDDSTSLVGDVFNDFNESTSKGELSDSEVDEILALYGFE